MRLYKRGSIWHGWYYDPEGKQVRISLKTTDKAIAERTLKAKERAAHDPNRPASDVTTELALQRAIAAPRRKPRGAATIDFYVKKAGHLIRLLPELFADVTFAVVEDYIQTRREEGASDHTISKELTTLRLAIKHARKRGEYPRAYDEVIPDFGPGYVPCETFLTRDQAKALLSKLAPNRAAHVGFIIATGARWSESVNAQAGDVKDGLVLLRGTKTESSWRTVPVAHPDCLKGDPPFDSWGNVRRDLAVACRAAGVPAVTPNDLRRTCATWLRTEGVEPQLIGSLLGHKDSRMVERVYGRLSPGDLAYALDHARCDNSVINSSQSQSSESPQSEAPPAGSSKDSADLAVSGDRIELSTRGFSVRIKQRLSSRNH